MNNPTDPWGYNQCPGYKRTCAQKKLAYFKLCIDCASRRRHEEVGKALGEKAFWQDKQNLALNIN